MDYKNNNLEEEEVGTSALNEESEIEVEPVNLGKKKVGVILKVVIVIVLLMCCFFGYGLTWLRKTSSSSQYSNTGSGGQSVELEVSVNSTEESIENSENTGASVEVGSSSVGSTVESEVLEDSKITETEGSRAASDVVESTLESLVPNETGNTGIEVSEGAVSEGSSPIAGTESPESSAEATQQEANVDDIVSSVGLETVGGESEGVVTGGLETVSVEPVLGAEVETSGIVSGMSMYRVGSSYTYGVNIILVTGNDANVECSYFCPRNTYSALEVGDSLVVKYQMDSMGNVSISSISR